MTLNELEQIKDKYIEDQQLSEMPEFVLKLVRDAINFGYTKAQNDIFCAIQASLSITY